MVSCFSLLIAPNKIGWYGMGPAMVVIRMELDSEPHHGQAPPHRRPLGAPSSPPSASAQAQATRPPRPPSHRGPEGPDRHPVRPQDRDQLGGPPGRDGLRLRDDLLAPPARLGGGRRLGQAP